MPVTLTIRDESAAGELMHELPLEFPSERITIRVLIRERVYQEVQDFNRTDHERFFRGLVQPSDAECVLNGPRHVYRLKQLRQIDWKLQYEKALAAFENNGFLILVNEAQAENLDQVVEVKHDTQISFVKLALLVGG